jgi:hypothetical protein
MPRPATRAADRLTVGRVVRTGQMPNPASAFGTGAGWRRVWRHNSSRLWVPHSSGHSAQVLLMSWCGKSCLFRLSALGEPPKDGLSTTT